VNITNNTSYPLIAFCWHIQKGYGDDVEIQPNQSADVSGPYIGEMGGGNCYIVVPGKIVCQETPDDEIGFHVSTGNLLVLRSGDIGTTVRHSQDKRDV